MISILCYEKIQNNYFECINTYKHNFYFKKENKCCIMYKYFKTFIIIQRTLFSLFQSCFILIFCTHTCIIYTWILFTKVFIYHKKIITIKILSNYNNIMLHNFANIFNCIYFNKYIFTTCTKTLIIDSKIQIINFFPISSKK